MAAWRTITALALTGMITLAAPACAELATSATSGARKPDVMSGDERVKAVQQALRDKGRDPGAVDGRMGPKTEAALRDFQQAEGIEVTGQLDVKTMQALGIDEKTS